jgi:glyoxylase-like metal-dependent hydrolase (beta-lactamase superfamily II)
MQWETNMDGIAVQVLGDNGPFSRTGKSVGYLLRLGQSSYLLDCGTPLFQQIGGHGLKEIEGLILTHCHDDHKRWFTDLALFFRYAPDMRRKLRLFTTEAVYHDLKAASIPTVSTGLSDDATTVTDVAFEDFIDYRMIGPKTRYNIVTRKEGGGKCALAVVDGQGNVLPPEAAKVIIHPATKRPRMLFRDPGCSEWIEPASFYPFSAVHFYEEDQNIYECAGYAIEALTAPVWHGISCTGVKITRGEETLIFSSDTVHDRRLWKRLCSEKRPQRLRMSKRAFESAPVIYGDINDYIERIWSEERYAEAVTAFANAAVIHDITAGPSVVHTSYQNLKHTTLRKERTLLASCPDKFTSEWSLCSAGKTYRVEGSKFQEVVGDRCCPLDADLYHKSEGKFFVGYKSEKGNYSVYRQKGLLNLTPDHETVTDTALYRVDLYEDVAGGYFPALNEPNASYLERGDGKVELLTFYNCGSRGKIVTDQRKCLAESLEGDIA